MQIIVKNIQQETISIDVDPEMTIVDLKHLIYDKKGGEYLVEKQQLIFGGQILENERTISSYGIDEGNFVVIMLKRNLETAEERKEREEQAKENEKENAKLLKTAESPENSKKKNATKEEPPSVDNTPTSISQSGFSHDHPSLEIVGQRQNEDIIKLIMDMGYRRETVEEALALNSNNTVAAIEYLLQRSDSWDSALNVLDSSLDNMSSAEPLSADDSAVLNDLSQEDRDAIERLLTLGFPLVEVIQVYFACGKNEELAASVLASSDGEDNTQNPQ